MRPAPNEHAADYQQYIALVPDGDILATLAAQGRETVAMLARLSEAQGDHRYAAGKWTLKEVVGHVIDTERIFACRALRFARGDRTPIPGYEQDDYVRNAESGARTLQSLIEEFEAVRRATVLFFAGLSGAAWLRRGIANHNEMSVRAVAWVLAGHELHHRRALQEKYLSPTA
ncbi:MAG TPA: DinB family protein [Bryobacteraceae bacterium]|nr:DinB family protein [Bryobacteraceae bacterium]